MSGPTEDSPQPRIYSQKVLGLGHWGCPIPKCSAPGPMRSTGWLELGSLGWWCIEFACADHGCRLVTWGAWSTLINEVLREHGVTPPEQGATPPA